MRKFLILILGLSLTAASCDITGGLFDLGGGGVKGVLKSEDNGETFNAANVLQKRGDINSTTVNSMVFDSGNPDVLYIGASNGIYKSDDAAKTWRYILSGISVADVAVDQYQANILFAAGISGTNGKIIKSLDGGTSWVDVYTEPSKNNAVLSIAISRTNSSIIIAGLNTGEIIRSTDGGHAWQAIKNLSDKVVKIRFGSNNTAYALTVKNGISRSIDVGVTWASISNMLSGNVFSNSNQQISSVTAFYDLALDQRQSGVLYLGTEQGLFRTVNDGGSWALISLPVKNAALRATAVAVNPSNSNNIFTTVASTLFKSVNGGLTWETKVLPTGQGVRVIQINPQSGNLIFLGIGAPR